MHITISKSLVAVKLLLNPLSTNPSLHINYRGSQPVLLVSVVAVDFRAPSFQFDDVRSDPFGGEK